MSSKDQEAAVPVPVAKSASLREKVEVAVQQWADEAVRNTPVAQEPRAYAHMVNVAIPRLKEILLQQL